MAWIGTCTSCRAQCFAVGGLLLALALTGCPSSSPGASRAVPPSASSPAPPPHVRFRDVTQEAGLRFRHNRATSGKMYFVEIMGAGGLFLDYDGDGDQDLFLLNGAHLPGFTSEAPLFPALCRNDGQGTFTDVTRQAGLAVEFYGMGAAAADYDNDGDVDLYATAVLGPSHLFRNDGDGTFTEVTEKAGVGNGKAWGTSAAWLDYDRDGWVDLFVCNYVYYYSLKDDKPCYFREGVRTYCIPFTYEGEKCRLYRNRGDGTFEDVSKASGVATPTGKSLGVVVWDFDNDDWPDIFVANDTEPTFLFRNNGDGTFSEMALEQGLAFGETGGAKAGMGIDLADDLNNGLTTYAGGAFSGETYTLARRQPGGFFQDEAVKAGIGEVTLLPLGFGTVFFDFDNDGWQDLLFVNGHVYDNVELLQDNVTFKQEPLLFWNRRDGAYQEVGKASGAPFTTRMVGRSGTWGDINDDGRLDLLLTENDGPARLWRNETPEAGQNHWLKLVLEGTKSNRSAIGARITVKAGGLTRTTQIKAGHSYLCQSDLRPHFGLGSAGKVEEMEIRWPSGAVDRWRDLAADQILRVREGETQP